MSDIDECSSIYSSGENDENVTETSSLQPFNFEPQLLKEEQALLPDSSEIVIAVVITKNPVSGTIIGVLVGVTVDQ